MSEINNNSLKDAGWALLQEADDVVLFQKKLSASGKEYTITINNKPVNNGTHRIFIYNSDDAIIGLADVGTMQHIQELINVVIGE